MTLNYLSESEVIPNETLALSPVKLPGSLEKDTPLSQMNPYLDISAIEMPSPIVHYIPIESPKKRQNLFNPQSKIISVLKKTERTYNEAVFIYKFLKDFSFFKKFKQDNPKLRSTEALIHLCRRLEYHVYSPGTTIYRKGDPSNGRVYMVYSGKVDLCDVIPKKNFDASPQSINRPEKSLKANRSSFKDDSKTPKSSKNLNKFSEQAKVELSARVINSHPSHPENFFLHPARVNSARKKSFINSTNESLSPEKHGKKTTPKGGRTLKRPNMPLLTLLRSEQDIDKRTPASGNFEGFSEVFKLRASVENLDTVTSHSLRRRHLSGRNNGDTPSSTLESDTPVSRKEIWEKSMPASSYQKNNYVPEVKSIFKKSSPKSIIVNNDTEEEDEDDEILEEEVFEAIISQGNYSSHVKSERDVRVRRRVVVKGELFGEEVLHDASPDFEEIVRKFTVEVVGERECGLLSFKREDYEYMLTRYSYKNTKVVDFLLDNIPYLEKSVKERKIFEMEGIFLEEGLNWKQLVTAQGQKGSKIYMLFEGLCEISKEVKISDTACASTCPSLVDATTKKEINGLSKDYGWNTKTMKIPICEVKAGVFLGEEILFNNTGEYEYSVKASTTQIKLLGIEKETFLEIMPEPVQNGLRSLYNQKREHNDEILAAKVKMQVNMQQARSIVLDNYENNKEDPSSKQAIKSQNMVVQSAKSLFTIPDLAGEEKRKNKVQVPTTTTEIKTRLNTAEVEKSHRRSIASETGVFFRDSFAKEIAKEPKTDVTKKMNRRRPILSAKPDNTLRSENSQTSILRRQRQSLVIKPSEGSLKTKEKEVEKNLISSAINSPSGDFTSIKFDFGRDVNDTIGSKVYHDLEKGKEEKTVLKMKKNMMDRQKANQSAKSSAHKLSNFLNSSKSIFGVESASTVWLQSPKTVLSGAANSFAFSPSSSKAKEIILQEPVALSFRRESTARISIEKRGRAFSVKNVEQPPPLKTELREAYPIIEIKGKSMPWKHRMTRRSLASDELK